MSSHFLYLTNTRLVSIVTRGKRIVARREFAVSGAGAVQFEQHLAGIARMPVHLFTDSTDEDFRLDTVPHVGSRDRAAVVSRKLTQIFRNTPYRHAVLQGRERDGRRDDRVMYTAVTNPEVLRPWIEVIDRLKVPLAGIYSAAVFSAVVLDELDLEFPHTLLVTFTPGEAMRQTYFRDGEIKFSRLTPVDLEEGQTLGTMLAEETTRTWQYLDSLRHFGPDDRLEVCVLVHANDRAVIQPELRDFAQIQYRLLDIEEISTRLGLKPAPLDSTAEEVMVYLFLLRPAGNHFANPELRRHATLRRVRIGLNQAAAAVLAAGIAWGGLQVARAFQGSDRDLVLEGEVSRLQREYEDIASSTPSLGVAGATMRDAVAFYNTAIRSFPTLPGFVAPISGVLRSHPRVRLTQLSWLATDEANASAPLAMMTLRDAPAVKAVGRAGSAPAPRPRGAKVEAPFAGGRYEIASLEATVRVDNNDFRAALAEAQRLAADISALPAYRAEVAESPLDVRSTLQLQGRHGLAEPDTMQARFVLRVVRERGPER